MVLYAFACFFIIISLIPFSRIKHWIVRGWDYVRVQTSMLQVVNLALIGLFAYPVTGWQYAVAGVLVLILIMQLIIVAPYTPFYPTKDYIKDKSKNTRRITLLTANVFQDNRNYDGFLSLVARHDPDLFLTMESDEGWEEALDAFAKTGNKKNKGATYPFSIKVPLDNYYGMHLYSKYELGESQVNYLVEDGVPSIFTQVHYRYGVPLNIICLHPAPPSPTENETSKERDAELLIAGKAVRELHAPIVVCGDLNDVVWSRISRLFAKMTGMVDPRMGRGLFPTFHAKYWYLRFPIDHMFHSRDILMEDMERLDAFGSDHFPMFFTFKLENGPKDTTHPDLDEDTRKDIEETIDVGLDS